MKRVLEQKARKILAIICALAICCVSLTGCRGPQYTEDEAKQVVDKGTALMIERIPSSGLNDNKLTWKKTEHGWTLVDGRGNDTKFYATTELVIDE